MHIPTVQSLTLGGSTIPNLDYDPNMPTDLLGRRIHEGDIVAWGTTYGKSPALCVAKIEKIRYRRKNLTRDAMIDTVRGAADEYQLILRPIVSTGDITWYDLQNDRAITYWLKEEERLKDPYRYEAKTKIIKHVKNVVKLEAADYLV